jgi:hypothetical protein
MPTRGEVFLALMGEELATRHRGVMPCIAYTEEGTICRQPATILDRQRQGMVCTAHDPQQRRGPSMLDTPTPGLTISEPTVAAMCQPRADVCQPVCGEVRAAPPSRHQPSCETLTPAAGDQRRRGETRRTTY